MSEEEINKIIKEWIRKNEMNKEYIEIEPLGGKGTSCQACAIKDLQLKEQEAKTLRMKVFLEEIKNELLPGEAYFMARQYGKPKHSDLYSKIIKALKEIDLDKKNE